MGLDFTGGNQASAIPMQTLGWEFTLSSAQTVTQLGLFDVGADGFVENHRVGLWSLAGASLGEVTVTSASTAMASTSTAGVWRFASLGSAINLGPGTYVIGADYMTGLDRVMTNTNAPITMSGLTFVRGRFVTLGSETAGFDFPDNTFSTSGGHFGPNLVFGNAPALTPEVPGIVMVVPMLLAVGGMALYKRKKQAAQS